MCIKKSFLVFLVGWFVGKFGNNIITCIALLALLLWLLWRKEELGQVTSKVFPRVLYYDRFTMGGKSTSVTFIITRIVDGHVLTKVKYVCKCFSTLGLFTRPLLGLRVKSFAAKVTRLMANSVRLRWIPLVTCFAEKL